MKVEEKMNYLLAAGILLMSKMESTSHSQLQEIIQIKIIISLNPVIQTGLERTVIIHTIERVTRIQYVTVFVASLVMYVIQRHQRITVI